MGFKGSSVKLCIFGLWHLGSVTAACMAGEEFAVTGLDTDKKTIENLIKGIPPLFEPGLDTLIKEKIANESLKFTTDIKEALQGASVVWVSFDTPVDDNDHADINYVTSRIEQMFAYLEEGTVVLISSQLPAGTTAKLEKSFSEKFSDRQVYFAYSPENLRLGKAIEVFRNQDRVVIGIRGDNGRGVLGSIFNALGKPIVWMSIESAEMVKHALNAFLATSVSFINEIASICERVGADASEVEQGLKTEPRIGPKAYLRAGGPFAGGTLARDVSFLIDLADTKQIPRELLHSIIKSNEDHKSWPQRKLKECFQSLNGKTIGVLGLTYKPGTDTLRRSPAVELCRWLHNENAHTQIFDPVIKVFPSDFPTSSKLCLSVEEAAIGAHALVVATEWEEFKRLTAEDLTKNMASPWVLDQSRFLEKNLGSYPAIKYLTLGKPL